MSIPIAILLYVYMAVALVCFVVALMVLMQSIRFGMHSTASYAVSGLFLGIMVLVVVLTMVTLRSTDWSSTMDITVPGISHSSDAS